MNQYKTFVNERRFLSGICKSFIILRCWKGYSSATSYAKAPEVKEGYGEHGRFTEWLGRGLQNRLRRFESATDLNNNKYIL
jgi:hypothetical protein